MTTRNISIQGSMNTTDLILDSNDASVSANLGEKIAMKNTFDISRNVANISANTADITTNAANISTNTANISTNAANISTNTANISTNAANISANTADISTNAANISANTADISTNAANISTNTADISTNAANISANASDISELKNTAVLTDPTLPTLKQLGLTAQFDYGTGFEPTQDTSDPSNVITYQSDACAVTSYWPIAEHVEKISVDIVHNVTKYNPPKFSVTVVSNDKIGSVDVMDRVKNHYSQAANFLAKNDLPLSPLTYNISKEASTNFRYNGIMYTDLSSADVSFIWQPIAPDPTPGVYTLVMKDSYGDGWNNNQWDLRDLCGNSLLPNGSVTLASGAKGSVTIAANLFTDDVSVNVVCLDTGNYKSEVSWELYDESANKVLSGGCPYDQVISFPLPGTPFDDTPVPMIFKNPVVEQPANITINGKWHQFFFKTSSSGSWLRGYLYIRELEKGIGYLVLSSGNQGTMMKMHRVHTTAELSDASNNGKLMFHYDETTMHVIIKGSHLEYSFISGVTDDTFDPSSSSYSPVLDTIGKATYCADSGFHVQCYDAMVDLNLVFVNNVNGNLVKSHPSVAEYGIQHGSAYFSILKTNQLNYFINPETGKLADARGADSFPVYIGQYFYSPSPTVVQGESYNVPNPNSHNGSRLWVRLQAKYRPNLVGTWRGMQLVPFNYNNSGSQNILHAVNGESFNAWAWNGVRNSGVHNARSDLDKRFGIVGTLNSNFFTALLPACTLSDNIDTFKPEMQGSFDSFNFMVAGHEYSHSLQQGVQGGWMIVQEDGDDLCQDGLCCQKSRKKPEIRCPTVDKGVSKVTRGVFGLENTATFMEKMNDYSPNVATSFRYTGIHNCLLKVLDGTFFYDVGTMYPSYDAVSHTAILEDYIHIPGNNNTDGTPKRELIKFNFDFTNYKQPIVSKNNKPAPTNTESLHSLSNRLVNDSHDPALTWQGAYLFYWFKEAYGYTGYDILNQAFLYAGKDNTDKIGLKYEILEIATKLSMLYNKSQRSDIPDKYKISENTIRFDLDYGSQFLDLPNDTQDQQVGQYIDQALANLPEGWFNSTDPAILKAMAKAAMFEKWGHFIRNDIHNFRISRTTKNHYNTPPTKYGSGMQPGKAIVDTSANGLTYSCESFSCFGLNKFSYTLDASGLPMVDASGNVTHESNVSQFSIKLVNLDASGVAVNTDLSGTFKLRLTAFNKKSEPSKLLELQTVGVDVSFVEADVTLVLNGPSVEINMYTLLGIDGVADKSDYNINCIVANLSENPSVNIVLENIVSTNMAL